MMVRKRNKRGNRFAVVPVAERFEDHFVEDDAGCWVWFGALDRKGYGRIVDGHGRKWLAHRWAFAALRHPVPDSLTLDHLCRVRRCVNPWHLEAVASGTNTLRGDTIASRNAAKTACPRGHEYSNVMEGERMRRRCMICQRESVKLCMRRKRLADRIAARLPPEPTP